MIITGRTLYGRRTRLNRVLATRMMMSGVTGEG
jgi:hypothetical protein